MEVTLPQTHYLGFDFSTQSLKAIIIDKNCRVLKTFAVNYEKDLPQYGTNSGILTNEEGEIFTNALMFLDALEMILGIMKQDKDVELRSIIAISGSGQQHGSVYWSNGAKEKLTAICFGEKSLSENFREQKLLASENCPIWMDSTTTQFVKELEEKFSPEELLKRTGSKAHERFTGNQIHKIIKKKPAIYEDCEHISLISSFISEVLTGSYNGIDLSDGSGMNLLNLNDCTWDKEIVEFIDPTNNLLKKLGEPIRSSKVVGTISEYFQNKYGFNQNCKITAFSGDNPCSLVGAGEFRKQLVISLGTSDTLITSRNSSEIDLSKFNIYSHIFISPEDEKERMIMLCTKNGALTREYYRDLYANGSWDVFESIISETPPGNEGIFGFFYLFPEIIPNVKKEKFSSIYQCQFKKDPKTLDISDVKGGNILRALVEGKIISLYNNLVSCGITDYEKILITGGGSKSKIFPQIIADIFNAKVYSIENEDSACYGAAVRALYADNNDIESNVKVSINELNKEAKSNLLAEPTNSGFYIDLINRYTQKEKEFLAEP